MIVPLPRRQRASEENVLPLINIVFLLLIFFMIAGALSASAPFELDPPATAHGDRAPAPTAGVAIGADGRIAFAGETVALSALADRAGRWREAHGGEEPLTLRADARTESERLLAVIGALREGGVERVRILAVGRRGDG
jgi:biopolymer transport protein ExbD